MKLFFLLLSLAFVSSECAKNDGRILEFQVIDSVTDEPWGGYTESGSTYPEATIDSNNSSVCLPKSGYVGLIAIASPSVSSVYFTLTRPNGHVRKRREKVRPFSFFANKGSDYFGRKNFRTGKDYILSADIDGKGTGSLSYVFQFQECANTHIAPPSRGPSPSPSSAPATNAPTSSPTSASPTSAPSSEPSTGPSSSPSSAPSPKPSIEPTASPTSSPTTANPTANPTAEPRSGPTVPPTDSVPIVPLPRNQPTLSPTTAPTSSPAPSPTAGPSRGPTQPPTTSPTDSAIVPLPSRRSPPTFAPGSEPTLSPTDSPAEPTSIPSAPFGITLDLVEVPKADEGFFTTAQSRWKSIITSGEPGGTSTALFDFPFPGCKLPTILDDGVYICASYAEEDGEGGVLGYAGPYHTNNGLPLTGFMVFDETDVKGSFRDLLAVIAMHEMGHVLGIGTLWESNGVAGPGNDCPYLGENAIAEFTKISGCPNNAVVPNELDGEPDGGTRCGHWDEACLGNELMTGLINTQEFMPLSRITVGSLEDLGYSVAYNQADAFGNSDLGSCPPCPEHNVLDRRHGETRQLGLRRGQTKPRKLSVAARQNAIEAGLSFLEKHAPPADHVGSNGGRLQDENLTIVVGDVVSVIVDDGGTLFHVIVKRQDE